MNLVMLRCHRVLSYLWMAQHCLHCVCDKQDVSRTRDDDQEPIHYLQQDTRVNMQHSACSWKTAWRKGYASLWTGFNINKPWNVELKSASAQLSQAEHLHLCADYTQYMKLLLALFCYITGLILPSCTTAFNLKYHTCQSCHLLIVPKSLHSAKELLRTTCYPRVHYKQDRQCKYNVTLLLQWKYEYYKTRVCVFVASGIQNVMRMRYIAMCGLPHSYVT